MTFIMYLALLCFVVGLVGVASNPSPYFAAFGLVLVAGMGCGILLGHGGAFLSLILLLIYLGGMLVVFAYSAALAAEPYPESWGSRPVVAAIFLYMGAVGVALGWAYGGWYEVSWTLADEFGEFSLLRGDMVGVALMYGSGGWMLVISAWVLFLTLLVVLSLTRGLSRGALRVV
ncbi:NADH dehydrogenase subunit 6 (mitochondrion) [Scophthalmus maximus]|uniref:NADH-ubiquinone oxidoreductase chain 6 n=1 Tax=Scophthalmus maximus TaxID=52904 RepID=C7S7B7_SCOMX|nr:NADH dehydrogenase subunit 6 [Scophthalmus maximus]ABY79846.1 NADH dehydrogenase subunit 6 [Scophthalmus maximus]QIA92590.1 NADH dehydrogenase subunit 6 [Scophthalmus maximus]